jgi:hypothetical protein
MWSGCPFLWTNIADGEIRQSYSARRRANTTMGGQAVQQGEPTLLASGTSAIEVDGRTGIPRWIWGMQITRWAGRERRAGGLECCPWVAVVQAVGQATQACCHARKFSQSPAMLQESMETPTQCCSGVYVCSLMQCSRGVDGDAWMQCQRPLFSHSHAVLHRRLKPNCFNATKPRFKRTCANIQNLKFIHSPAVVYDSTQTDLCNAIYAYLQGPIGKVKVLTI